MVARHDIRKGWAAAALAAVLLGGATALCSARNARADANGASDHSASDLGPQPAPAAPLSQTVANDATAQLSYLEWREPMERSFSVDVPAGWSITGGVAWNTIYAPRQWVKASSPDRRILVFYGDPDMLPRFVPNPLYAQMGWTRGRVIRDTAGTAVLMEPYRPGEAFARQFVQQTACATPTDQGTFRLGHETAALDQVLRPFVSVIPVTVTAGEYLFSCWGRFEGYAHAITVRVGGPTANWDILNVMGFSAAGGAANYEIGRLVLLHVASSFRVDPAWQAHVQAALGAASISMVQATNATGAMMLESARRTLDAHTRAPQAWSDVILGQQHVCDDLGHCQETTNRCDHVWSLAGSFVCGPSDGSPPDARPWHGTHRSE